MATKIVAKQPKQPLTKRAVPKTAAKAQAATEAMTEAKSNGHAGGNGKPAPQPITTHEALETVRRVPIELLLEHPRNQHRDAADLVPSIQEHGVHDPLICRPMLGQLQILCGHRRYNAAKVAKLSHLPVRVVELDDLAALRLLHRDNGQREDLSPIQRARALEDLVAAGLTITQAADDASISRPAASNLLRLLELPEPFQKRVAAGEVPQTFARDWLLPVGDDPAAVAAIDEWIGAELKEHGDLSMSRHEFGEGIHDTLSTVWGDITSYSNPDTLAESEVDQLDEATREQLGLRELPSPWYDSPVAYATNTDAYKKLITQREQGKKYTAAKQVQRESAKQQGKPKETAAQQRAREAKRAKQLAEKLDAWVDRLLRWQLAEILKTSAGCSLSSVRDAAARVLLYRAANAPPGMRWRDLGDAIAGASAVKGKGDWAKIAALDRNSVIVVVSRLIHPQLVDHPLEREVRDPLCDSLGVTRETAWRAAAICGDGMLLIDEWLALHTKSELIEIAAAWGVEAAASIKAGDLLERLGQHVEHHGESIDLPAELVVKERVARKGAKARRKK